MDIFNHLRQNIMACTIYINRNNENPLHVLFFSTWFTRFYFLPLYIYRERENCCYHLALLHVMVIIIARTDTI